MQQDVAVKRQTGSVKQDMALSVNGYSRRMRTVAGEVAIAVNKGISVDDIIGMPEIIGVAGIASVGDPVGGYGNTDITLYEKDFLAWILGVSSRTVIGVK